MHAIERVIDQFLDESSKKKKIVLNLGCGYDPVPFQWLSKHQARCQDVTFVDVDYPDLIEKKCNVISTTSQLRDLLGPHDRPLDPSGPILRSEHYLAIGCDLADITRLDMLLTSEVQMSNCLVLCTAEVSITYMNTNAADALIRWAGLHDDMRFCLLEQYLPDGAEHPFAQKMVRHFHNLQTPLRSIHQYPRLADQERRFLEARWSSVSVRSLWDSWNDDFFISSDRRLALNDIEPFDEWEEFVLFASHYFLLLATNTSSWPDSNPSYLGHPRDLNHLTFANLSAKVPLTLYCEAFPSSHRRRFGALTPLSQNTFGHHGGLGVQTRLSKTDVYTIPGMGPPNSAKTALLCEQLETVEPRMCHTITSDRLDFLVAGGRASPDNVFQDCWLSGHSGWQRIEDLPIPLFRHCATTIALENPSHSTDNAFLIYGGKTGAGHVSDQWLLLCKNSGWIKVPVTGDHLEPRFGAVMQDTGFRRGILLGGMANDGKILSEAWEWTISGDLSALSISLNRMAFSGPDTHPIIGRLGASLVKTGLGLLLVGGVCLDLIPQSLEFIMISREKNDDDQNSIWKWVPVDARATGHRPLLIGHSTFASLDNVTVLGGGAVCFSFGTFWNEIILSVSSCGRAPQSPIELMTQEPDPFSERKPTGNTLRPSQSAGTVTRDDQVQSSSDFEQILNDGRPVIMGNLDMGLCPVDWTLPSLTAKIGGDRDIVVHEASDKYMDFQHKNFRYVKKPFKDFIDDITGGSPQYLRSLSSENPAGKPADISVDFPELASSFGIPPQLDAVKQKMHSSVLRISGPVTMWLHYDVKSNVLCQIHGSKRLILYPPSDVSLFSIPPGTSSSSINCFDTGRDRHSSLALTHPQEALLQPGDVLFIPPLWLHTASPVDNVSISVNVFFRNMDAGYAPGRDTYGNRDLQAYEKGRRDIEKISKSFDKLPTDMGKFYLERLADELKEKAQRHGS